MRYNVTLKAGEPKFLPYVGSFLRLFTIAGAKYIDVSIAFGDQQAMQRLGLLAQNAKVPAPAGFRFSGIELASNTDATVDLLVADMYLDLDIGEAAVDSAINAGPVPVDDNITIVLGADTNRDSIYFYNKEDSTDAVSIFNPGGGLDWNSRTIVLQPGEGVKVGRDEGARLQWLGICDTGGAASVTARVMSA